MDRKSVLDNMDKLCKQCEVCALPPVRKAFQEKRRTWCQENCHVPGCLKQIGKQLDEICLAERADRAVQRHMKMQKSPDVGASELAL